MTMANANATKRSTTPPQALYGATVLLSVSARRLTRLSSETAVRVAKLSALLAADLNSEGGSR